MVKKGDGKDVSNTVVAIVLVLTILVSIIGTLIIAASFSSIEPAPSSNLGTVGLTVINPPPISLPETQTAGEMIEPSVK